MAQLRDVSKVYGSGETEVKALDGLDLDVLRGDYLAVMGASGSGKSTLLRCVNMLETPTAGTVVVLGRELTDIDCDIDEARAHIGMVFQQFNLWSHMTILQNVMEAPVTVLGLPKDVAETAARGYLEKVGIGEKCDAFPAQLSGGQQQRAAIARGLCMSPEALLFDEPTSALDPELEQEVIAVIKDLASEGRTMVIVTHDMKLAADVADHVVFLHLGRIEEEGPPATLFGAPKSQRLQQFLSSTVAA